MQIHVRVVAPASPLGIVAPEIRRLAEAKIRTLGWEMSFGSHVFEKNDGSLSSANRRVTDIHDALTDPSVTHLMAAIGGWESHELLPLIDWDLWRDNPKPLIGYSDVTALQNASLAVAGVKSIYGPVFSTLGQPTHLEFTIRQLIASMSASPHTIDSATYWIDDEWYLNLSETRPLQESGGYHCLQAGNTKGVAIGGNISTFLTLAGTKYMPPLVRLSSAA